MADDRDGAFCGNKLHDRAAETTEHGGLFAGDDRAGFKGSVQDQVLVEGLDRVDIQHARGNAFRREDLTRCSCHGYHHAGRGDGNVVASRDQSALAKLEAVAGKLICEDLRGRAGKAEIGGAVVIQQGFDSQAHLVAVAGIDDQHAGDLAHEGKVLGALMGRTVLADRNAAVRADDLDIQVRISDGIAHLLIGAAGREHRKGAGKGLEPGCRQTGSDADHVALCDAAVEEPFRIGSGKILRLCRLGKVRIQDNQFRILFCKVYQRFSESAACCDLSCHISSPPVS